VGRERFMIAGSERGRGKPEGGERVIDQGI